jgi:hypothetical protein
VAALGEEAGTEVQPGVGVAAWGEEFDVVVAGSRVPVAMG